MSKDSLLEMEWHKKQAVENFNYTWDLIDKNSRTNEEDMNMIHTAHASRFHWGKVGTAVEFARGEWQISRVYALLSMGESALLHGQYSLQLCNENGIEDFDLAFAYEAIARAYSIMNNVEQKQKYTQLAKKASNNIANKDDKDYLLSELNSIK